MDQLTFCELCHSTIAVDTANRYKYREDSPLRFRMSHGFSPTEKQHAASTLAIKDLSADLLTIKREMHILRDRLAALQILERRHETSISLHSASLAPILRLPVEILTRIFSFAVSHDVLDKEHRKLPVTLTRVCTYWEEVCLSHPDFWTTLVVLPGDDNSYVDAVLRRSGSRPLQVAFSGNKVDQLAAILDCATRWENVIFSLHADRLPISEVLSLFQEKLGEPNQVLPWLTSFNISVTCAGPPRQLILPILGACPALRSLGIGGSLGIPDIPWHSLVNVSFTNRTEGIMHDFLTQTTDKLKNAALHFPPPTDVTDAHNHITLSNAHLRSLSLTGICYPSWVARLRLPQLESLDLTLISPLHRPEHTRISYRNVTTLIRGSACSRLTSLSIDVRSIIVETDDVPEELLDLLRACASSLTSLSLRGGRVHLAKMCRSLRLDGNPQTDVLRGLTELRLLERPLYVNNILSKAHVYEEGAFTDMMESRRAWLKTLVMEVEYSPGLHARREPSCMEYLDGLVMDGMDVIFADPKHSKAGQVYHFVCSPKHAWYSFLSVPPVDDEKRLLDVFAVPCAANRTERTVPDNDEDEEA